MIVLLIYSDLPRMSVGDQQDTVTYPKTVPELLLSVLPMYLNLIQLCVEDWLEIVM